MINCFLYVEFNESQGDKNNNITFVCLKDSFTWSTVDGYTMIRLKDNDDNNS